MPFLEVYSLTTLIFLFYSCNAVQEMNDQESIHWLCIHLSLYITHACLSNRHLSPKLATKGFPPCFQCSVIMPAEKKKNAREVEYSLRICHSKNGHDLPNHVFECLSLLHWGQHAGTAAFGTVQHSDTQALPAL